MSLRYEQHAALKQSHQLLVDLLRAETRPKNMTELKSRVMGCLRHYPLLLDSGKPIWSKDEFTDPKTGAMKRK